MLDLMCLCWLDNPAERPTRVASKIIDCSTEMDATATSIESAMDLKRSRRRQFFGYAQFKYLYMQENAIRNHVRRRALAQLG